MSDNSYTQLDIYTGMFSDKVEHILNRLKTYALKEDQNATNRQITNFVLAKITRAPNNEIIWTVNLSSISNPRTCIKYKYNTSYFYKSTYNVKNKNPEKIREWLAVMLKEATIKMLYSAACDLVDTSWAKREKWIKENWKRDSDLALTIFSQPMYTDINENEIHNNIGNITVSDIYCVYDKLLNRKRIKTSYSKNMLDDIIGTAHDPLITEMETFRRSEASRLEIEYYSAISKLNTEMHKTLDDVCKEIRDKYNALKLEVEAKYKNETAKLNESLSFIQNI